MQHEEIVSCLKEIGCPQSAIDRAEALVQAGDGEALIRCLRRCRCDLMDDLHESQKRVDRMDYLIRQTEKTTVR
ncbi:MAG: hypothetical protein IKR85_00055 [Clostridia bacterium]|nr:hypothetical protein [Clostridia bacterium]